MKESAEPTNQPVAQSDYDNTFVYFALTLLVLDDQGEIVLTLTSPSKTRKFEETYASVKEGDLVDKKMKTIGEAAASRIR